MESEDFSSDAGNVFNDPSHEKSTPTIMMNKGSGEYTMLVTNTNDLKKINYISSVKAQTSVNETLSPVKKNPKILPGPAPSTSKTLPTTALLVKNQMPTAKKIVAVANPFGTKINQTNVLKKQIIQLDRYVGEQKQGQSKQDTIKVVPKPATVVGSPSLISKSNPPTGMKIVYKNNAGNLVFTPAPGNSLPSLAPKPSPSTTSSSFPLISISKPEYSPISISQSGSKTTLAGIQLTPVTYVSGQVSPGHIRLTVPAAKIVGSPSTIPTGKFVNGPTIKVVRSGAPGIPLLTTMAKTVPSGLVSGVSTVKTMVSGSAFPSSGMKTIAVTQVTNMGKPRTIEIIKPLIVAGKAKENSLLLTPVTAPSEVPKKSSPKDDRGKESSIDPSEFFIINKDSDRRSPSSGFGITKSPIELDEVLEIVSPDNKPSLQDSSDSKCITDITPDSPPGRTDMKILRAHYSDIIAQCLHKFSSLVLRGALSLSQSVETLALLLDRVAVSPLGGGTLGDKAFFVSLKRRLQNVNLINQLSFIMNNMNLVCANLNLNRVSSHFLNKLNAFKTFSAEWTRDETSREWCRESIRLKDLCEAPCMTDAAALRHDLQSFFLNVTTFMESILEEIKDIVKKFINYLKEGLGLSLAKGSVMQSARYPSDEIYQTFVLLNKEKTKIERTYRGIMARSGASDVTAARGEVITIEEEDRQGSPDCVEAARHALDMNKKKIVETTAHGMDVSRRIIDATMHVWDVSKRMTEATTKAMDVNQEPVGVARENTMLSVPTIGEETGELKRIQLKKPETLPSGTKTDDITCIVSKTQDSSCVETSVGEDFDSLCEELKQTEQGPVETSSFKDQDTLIDIFEPSPEKNETNLSDDYSAFVISSEEEEDMISESVTKEGEIESETELNVIKSEEKPIKKYMSPMEQFVEKYRASAVSRDATMGKLSEKINEINKQNSAKRCAGNVENVSLKESVKEAGNPKNTVNSSQTAAMEEQQNSEESNVIGNRTNPSTLSALSIDVNTGTNINLDSSINKTSPPAIHATSVTVISSSHSPTTIEHLTLESAQKSVSPNSSYSPISTATTTVNIPIPSPSVPSSTLVSQSGVPQGSTLCPLISQSQSGVSHESTLGSTLSLSSSNFSSPTITVQTKPALSPTPIVSSTVTPLPSVSTEAPVTSENSVATVKKFPHPELFEEIKQVFTREQKTLDSKLSKSALLNKSSKTIVYTRKVSKFAFKKLPEPEDDVTIIDTKLSQQSNQLSNKSKALCPDGAGSKELDNSGDSLKVRNVQRINDLSCNEVFVEETMSDRGKGSGEKFICLFDLAAEESVNKPQSTVNSDSEKKTPAAKPANTSSESDKPIKTKTKSSEKPSSSSENTKSATKLVDSQPTNHDGRRSDEVARRSDEVGRRLDEVGRRQAMSDEEDEVVSPSPPDEYNPDLPENRKRLRLLRQRYLTQQRDQALETACLAGMKAQALGFRVKPAMTDAASSDGTASGPDDCMDTPGGRGDSEEPRLKKPRGSKTQQGGIRPLSHDLVMGNKQGRSSDDVTRRDDVMGNKQGKTSDDVTRRDDVMGNKQGKTSDDVTRRDDVMGNKQGKTSDDVRRRDDVTPLSIKRDRMGNRVYTESDFFQCCFKLKSKGNCTCPTQHFIYNNDPQSQEKNSSDSPASTPGSGTHKRKRDEELTATSSGKRRKAKAKSDPSEIFRCESCGCYGDLGEFISERFCSDECQAHTAAAAATRRTSEGAGPLGAGGGDPGEKGKAPPVAAGEKPQRKPVEELTPDELYRKAAREWSWRAYYAAGNGRPAPFRAFRNEPGKLDKNPFRVGVKMEAKDPQMEARICVVTCVEVKGPRLRLHFDDYPDRHDFWVNASSPDLYPAGWNAQFHRRIYPPPTRAGSFSWSKYLAVTGAKAAPASAFTCSHMPPSVFKISHKLEAVNKKGGHKMHVATVRDVIGTRVHVHLDGLSERYDYWTDIGSAYIRSVGHCRRNNKTLVAPPGERNFNWDAYLNSTNSDPVPEEGFIQIPLMNAFEKGQKVEAVDPRVTSLIRVATVVEVDELRIKLSLDGFQSHLDYWVYYDSVNVHPPGWCERSGHPLEPPVGKWSSLETPCFVVAPGPCGTQGCAGRGHVDRTQATHGSAATCPYSPQNSKVGGGAWERMDRETEPLLAPLVETRRKYGGGDAGRTEAPGRDCRLSPPLSLLDEDSCGGVSTLSGGDGDGSEEELNVVDVTNERAFMKRGLLHRQGGGSKSSSLHSSSSAAAVPKPPAPGSPTVATAQSTARLHSLREAMVRSLYSAMPRVAAGPGVSLYWAQHTAASLGFGRLAERPEDPVTWGEAEVAEFVAALPDCEPLASEFQNQHLDGTTFLLLSQSDLRDILHLKMGPALKIYNAILLLRHKSELLRGVLFNTLDAADEKGEVTSKQKSEEKEGLKRKDVSEEEGAMRKQKTEEKEGLKRKDVSEDAEKEGAMRKEKVEGKEESRNGSKHKEVKKELAEEMELNRQDMAEMKEESLEEIAEQTEEMEEGSTLMMDTSDPLRREDTTVPCITEGDRARIEEIIDPLSTEKTLVKKESFGGELTADSSDVSEKSMASDVKEEVGSDVNRRATCDVKGKVADVNKDLSASDENMEMESGAHNEDLSEGVKKEVDYDEYSENPLITDVKSERLSTETDVNIFEQVDSEPVANSCEILEKSLAVDSFKLVDDMLADTSEMIEENATEEERQVSEENVKVDGVTDVETEGIINQMELEVDEQLGISENVITWGVEDDNVLSYSQEVSSEELESGKVSEQDDNLSDDFDLFDIGPNTAKSAPNKKDESIPKELDQVSDAGVAKGVTFDKVPLDETEKTLCAKTNDITQQALTETEDTDKYINQETDTTVQENNEGTILSQDKPSSSLEGANGKGLPMDID